MSATTMIASEIFALIALLLTRFCTKCRVAAFLSEYLIITTRLPISKPANVLKSCGIKNGLSDLVQRGRTLGRPFSEPNQAVAESAVAYNFLLGVAPFCDKKTRSGSSSQSSGGLRMSISIERDDFDAQSGYQYYLTFKPNMSAADVGQQVRARVPVEASLSISETGDLADLHFVLPKPCRSEQALTFIRRQQEAKIMPPQVFVALPGSNGDAVATAICSLDLDLAGRIIGMQIRWMPDLPS
jgi:hypothetical protein